ncbi:hypothetical protein V6N11_003346 [Hibiscus sabdariffa]|uniref:Uncharacterized protein n=1 Tax=Hibiscus sabdariffa TaxID=183260 RepID=A0ABR2SD17_9ROSI
MHTQVKERVLCKVAAEVHEFVLRDTILLASQESSPSSRNRNFTTLGIQLRQRISLLEVRYQSSINGSLNVVQQRTLQDNMFNEMEGSSELGFRFSLPFLKDFYEGFFLDITLKLRLLF